MTADPSEHDRFYMRQRFRLVVNLYEVSTLGGDGKSAGEPVAFARQRAFRLKELISVHSDDAESDLLLQIEARKVLDLGTTYDVTGPDGQPVGAFRKLFRRSLLRSSWELLDLEGQVVASARERSLGIALTRRLQDLIGIIPLIGDLLALIPIPYHFDFLVDGRRVGSMSRQIRIGDRYVIDLSADPERRIDRRLAIAHAIALDALQSR